jgi:hypothetical protein
VAVPGGTPFPIATVVIGAFALVGFVVAIPLPRSAHAEDRQAT